VRSAKTVRLASVCVLGVAVTSAQTPTLQDLQNKLVQFEESTQKTIHEPEGPDRRPPTSQDLAHARSPRRAHRVPAGPRAAPQPTCEREQTSFYGTVPDGLTQTHNNRAQAPGTLSWACKINTLRQLAAADGGSRPPQQTLSFGATSGTARS